MAIGTSFKQQCPSCEALVPVKDAGLVGKKIECPKCKDKFIVKSPEKKKSAEDEDEEDAPKSKTSVKAAPGKKPASTSRPAKKEDEEEEDLKKKSAKGKKKAQADDEEEEGGKKKKKAGASRFTMGIALGVVGLVVLAAAAYFILMPKSTPANLTKGTTPRPGASTPDPTVASTPKTRDKKGEKEPVPETVAEPPPPDIPLTAVSSELTNLLPNDTQHVAQVPFQILFNNDLLKDVLINKDSLNKDLLREKLGFYVLEIDNLIRADRYGPGGWSFTVVHFQKSVDQEAVKKALGLKPAPAVKTHLYYKATTSNPWFDQLARFALGVPRELQALSKTEKRQLSVHFHDPQTLIFADETPMLALLKENKSFRPFAENAKLAPKVVSAKQVSSPAPAPDAPMGTTGEAPPPVTRMESYMTIKPALKAIMERMEGPAADGKAQISWFRSATDLEVARLPGAGEADKGKSLWYPRQLWDVTLLLQDRNPRLRTLGVALGVRDDGIYRVRNELTCPLDNDARSLEVVLAEETSLEVALFFKRLLAHKVEVPKKEVPIVFDPAKPMPPPVPIDPTKEKKEEIVSRITVTRKDKTIDFILDLKLEKPEVYKLHDIASLIGSGLRAEMEVASGVFTRHHLAWAAKSLPDKGLTDRGVLPGNFPPGAFPRASLNTKRYLAEPNQRVSWMAGLLPFLGQETLYGKINFNDAWRGPNNWLPAGTLVPQFLDPAYPPRSYYVSGAGLPFELAATHFVGIAGVGLDAADYNPADPATANKRGVMSYDKGLPLEEVRSGHGLSNTIFMIQVPPDSLAGVTPWIAGGGSTLRGVPDKNSLAPFVFSSPGKDGKARRGTFAVMADGAVRFIDQNVSDDVFKAMATAKMPLPDDYDPDSFDSLTPLVKPPKGLESKSAPAVTQKK